MVMRLKAVLLGGAGVRFGLIMSARIMMMLSLTMMVGRRLMMRGRVLMMFTGRVLRRGRHS
jgi:hypothetical protein